MSKNLPMSIKILILVKYWYLLGMSRSENLCIPELLFGSIPFYTVSILKTILPKYEGSGLVYSHAWYWIKTTVKYPYPNGIENCKTLIIDTWMVNKRWNLTNTSWNLVHDLRSVALMTKRVLLISLYYGFSVVLPLSQNNLSILPDFFVPKWLSALSTWLEIWGSKSNFAPNFLYQEVFDTRTFGCVLE